MCLSWEKDLGRESPDAPRPESVRLNHIRFRMQLPACRELTFGGTEVVQALMVTVRDRNWGTVGGTVNELERDISPQECSLRFRCTHDNGDAGFVWDGTITAQALDRRTDVVTYCMTGHVTRDFLGNRVGICVLHPLRAAGTPVFLRSPQGTSASSFPADVAPWQLFSGVVGMSYSLGNVSTDICFEGDLFETEDQRNWTDASFKTYCPPLHHPFPRVFRSGEKLSQKVVVRMAATSRAVRAYPKRSRPFRVRLGDPTTRRLPSIGIGARCDDVAPVGADIRDALLRLRPSHLHVLVDANEPTWEDDLRRAAAAALQIDARLQCEVVAEDVTELETIADVLGQVVGDCPALLAPTMPFDRPSSVTTRDIVMAWQSAAIRHRIPSDVFGGSRANFAEFNRIQPPYALVSGVTFAISPQVHASGNDDIIKTLEVQEVLAQQAVFMAAGRSLHVGPVTLRPRFNPVATDPLGPVGPENDPRQFSLWTACWTLGSVRALARGGAKALTYFEAAGPGGVLCKVPSSSGSLLRISPVYQILARLTRHSGAVLVDAEPNQYTPLAILALFDHRRLTVVIGNLASGTVEFKMDETDLAFRRETLDVATAQNMLEGKIVVLPVDRGHSGLVQLQPNEIEVLTASV